MEFLSPRRFAASSGKRVFVAAMLAVAIVLGTLLPGQGSAQDLDVSGFGSDLDGLTATITNSDNGVNLRSEPSIDGDVLAKLPDGTVVELRIADVNTVYDGDGDRWWPVRANGVNGWIIGFYLGDATSAPTENDLPALETPLFGAGESARVATDDGGGLYMREFPDGNSDAIGKLSFGATVEIINGPYYDDGGSGWYLISNGEKRAFVFGAYLQTSSGSVPTSATSSAPAAVSFNRGDFAAADGTLNIRMGPSVGEEVVGRLAGGEVVEIVGGPVLDDDGDAWYMVEGDDLQGYAIATYLLDAAAPQTGPTTGKFIYPVAKYTFTQAFGCSPYAFEPYEPSLGCNFHNGIDLAAPAYTPIRAADGGVVTAAGYCDCGLGYYVRIDHENGFETVYGHMAETPYVSVGQVVGQGDVIGPMGSTGLSTGPHVHFMLVVNGIEVDPLGYL